MTVTVTETQKNHEKLTVIWGRGGGVNVYGQPEYPFLRLSLGYTAIRRFCDRAEANSKEELGILEVGQKMNFSLCKICFRTHRIII